MTILHIDASPRLQVSKSRRLSQAVVDALQADETQARVIRRDVSQETLPFVTEAMIGAYYTPADQRSAEQNQLLIISDQSTNELLEADVIVIGSPMWNFSVPASLKAWIDLVVRTGLTFKYTPEGPVGLLNPNTKVVLCMSTSGTPLGSDMDFLSRYLKFLFSWLNTNDITIIGADGQMGGNEEEKFQEALKVAQNFSLKQVA